MSDMGLGVGGKATKRSKLFIFWALAVVSFLCYLFFTREKFDSKNIIDVADEYNCLNSSGLNEMPDYRFEYRCEGKSFVATVYQKGCYSSSSCELSLFDPEVRDFESSTLFEADLVNRLGAYDEKLNVKGVISDRGFLGQVEVNIYEQVVVPLTPKEEAAREEARKPKVDPVVEAQKRWLEERAAENDKMREYAVRNDKELTAKSTRVQVDPDSVNGMAEYRYYLKSGNVVSCLRGFEANVFIYECKNHNFNR